MRVRFIGLLQNLLGTKEEELSLSRATTLRDLIGSLTERHGKEFQNRVLNQEGRLRQTIRVVVDGNQLDEEDALDTWLTDENELAILLIVPPMAGGCQIGQEVSWLFKEDRL